MAKFTIRVELRNADSSDYEKLHKKMAANGFKNIISSGSGNEYRLPTSEYIHESSTLSRSELADLVYGIAESIKTHPAVLVTESVGRTWLGLKKANPLSLN
ncbi:type V toxin-antitoxin system endoribonuclease antitoxin GhoS [Xenorhabdus sp. 42]|uniref:Type V toxin-antitoxin system endoribonuclease antitoxin GhoS n=1 Tax=Xenorhabdus szentirmaii TaxID=290112 RepID=A0AAW3YQ28_9GAMM|nr:MULTISPECIES: type V toxin-antitoxin system endoribonuclease antitoxin GhoS [unclassified Xenorhabdus]MBD2791961.1 type V toxin-antitoxin system endoribonuclease antitoxin GhoS [Xenorhabdus sp. CUL]MBD2799471.1 type V toxin-antitoxin system endoribonuclease antitoxin GhoS [Xenorhabdus sp. M]MBD2820887.1 type V toxin-antitoxin system endoribonuclease antitoxin GhoS [Xenorhabdus sp. 42]MBD2823631.1 type V toxin-antitoxin system endoribonuclease antitoxin GhoS [Xenorhabdus sp. 5]